jgi:chorismate mutase
MDRNEPGTSFMPRQGIKGFEEFMVVIEVPNAYTFDMAVSIARSDRFAVIGEPIFAVDPVREKEILDCVASRLHGVGFGREIGVAFFRDQIEANKVIQRNLHGRWRENPEESPVSWRSLNEESRPQLDVIKRHMLRCRSLEVL